MSSRLGGVVVGVISVGNSTAPIAGETSRVFGSENSVIAESGDRPTALSGMALSIFFCRRVLGTWKEWGENVALRLRRLFGCASSGPAHCCSDTTAIGGRPIRSCEGKSVKPSETTPYG